MHMMWRFVMLCSLALTACVSDSRGDFVADGDPLVDGPVIVSGLATSGDDAEVAGRIRIVGECLELDQGDQGSVSIAWPEGTTWDEEAQVVELRNGVRVGDGDRISGGGGYYSIDDPQPALDSFVASTAAACEPEVVVVLSGSVDELRVTASDGNQ